MDPLNTERECCRAVKRKMLDTQNDLQKRMTAMETSMKSQMKDLQYTLSKVNESLLLMMEQKNMKEPRTLFPLETEDDVYEMDTKISNSPSEFVELFERMLLPEGIIKNLERVLSTDLLMKFNFTGGGQRSAFDKFVHLNNAMYESLRGDGLSFVEYKRDIREAFLRAKNRIYKARQRLKLDQDDS